MELHRHRSSLERIFSIADKPSPLTADQRAVAIRRFYHIIGYFSAKETVVDDGPATTYNRPALVRLTYEYALSDESKDLLLQAFLNAMELELDYDGNDANIDLEGLRPRLFGFANHLMDSFFLPSGSSSLTTTHPLLYLLTLRFLVKASSGKTPQPSPVFHSAIERVQGGSQDFIGTPDRISALRGACLVRDRHRCVVTRRFDRTEAILRAKKGSLSDNDGNPLEPPFGEVEVAHILPHSLTALRSNDLVRLPFLRPSPTPSVFLPACPC